MNNDNIETIEEKMAFPVIGRPAPAFTAETTNGVINFPEDYKGKWVILFSHPADFTPVCTTEFMTFASMQEEFEALNTKLIGLSIDSVHSHLAWIKAIEKYEYNGIKDAIVKFPVIADLQMDVANKYGMLQGESDTSAVRAVFFINPEGTMKTILYYPASLGRNFEEIKRILIGLQKTEKEGVALPANWQPGKDVIVPPPSTKADLEKRLELKNDPDHSQQDWFLTFRKDK